MHGQPLNMQMHAQPSKSVYSHIHAQPLMRAVTWGNMVSAQKLTKPWRFKVCSGQKPKNTVTRSALNTASTCWTLDVYCSIPCSQNEMFVRKQNQKRQESANKTWRRTQINAQLLIQVNTCRTRPNLDKGQDGQICTQSLMHSLSRVAPDTHWHMQPTVHARLLIHEETCVHTPSSWYGPTYEDTWSVMVYTGTCSHALCP
jgi:hypothetical protein